MQGVIVYPKLGDIVVLKHYTLYLEFFQIIVLLFLHKNAWKIKFHSSWWNSTKKV